MHKLLTDEQRLEVAIQIASQYHFGQVDKQGKTYILHPLRVMLKGSTTSEQIVGVLHDIVEDTIITPEQLLKGGKIMSVLFINYPKCSTCINARKWLEENNIKFTSRHIVEDNPKEEELKKYIKLSGLPVKKFFNTSGMLYREMNLKEKTASATDDEMIKILATNGLLVKRPLVVTDDGVLIGFKADKWKEFFNK